MNTDAIDKLLEQIDATEHGHLREIIHKLVWARGEIRRLNALVNEVLDGRDKAADKFASHIRDFDRQRKLIELMHQALLDVKMNAAGEYKSYLISVDAALEAAEREGEL